MSTHDDVFLLDETRGLTRMEQSPYDREDVLQALLERHPVLIAGGVAGDRGEHLVLVKREASVPDREDASGRWSVDHLFVDAEAVPMLVEVKRSTDTRIRREMIGQMLDYAANAVTFWSADGLEADFEATCAAAGADPNEVLAEMLDEGEDAAGFWKRAAFNLDAGRVRLVFVADEIPFEVQRVVEFLNDQMSPAEVLAIEVRQYLGVDDGVKTIVPRVLGQTTKARQRKNPTSAAPPRAWDEPSLLTAIHDEAGETSAAVAKRILDWAREQGLEVGFGSGGKVGGVFFELAMPSGEVRIGSFSSRGRYSIQLISLRDVPGFDEEALDALIERYEQVDGTRVPRSRRWKKSAFDLQWAAESGALDQFLRVVTTHVASVRESSRGRSVT